MKIKSIISILVIFILVMSLFAGCGESNDDDKTTDSGTTNTNGTDNSSNDTDAANNTDEEAFEIVVELVTLGQDFTSLPLIEEEINKITLPEINATVKFLPIHIADHANKLSLMVASGEKLDLVMTGITTPLVGLASTNAIQPIGDLLDEYAPELVEKQGELLEATKFNGQVYAISADLYPAKAGGIVYNKEMADQYNVSVSERITLEDLSKIGEQLKQEGVYLTTPSDGALNSHDIYTPIADFGGDYAYGVIFDPVNSTEIVNYYASDEFREYALLLKSWMDQGYMPQDALTNGQNAQDVFRSEQVFYQFVNYSPGDKVQEARTWPFEVKLSQASDAILSTEVVQQFGYGIPVHCENPEAVVKFLNLIYTNADISNLLNHGIEGVEYQKVSDNIVEYVDGIDSSNAGYVRIFNRFGDAMQTYQMEPATEAFFDEIETFNEDAEKSKTLGYVFNAENVAGEVAAVNSVVSEYRPPLMAGAVSDVDQAIEEFNEALESAGINEIIEENRRQLGEWLAKQ